MTIDLVLDHGNWVLVYKDGKLIYNGSTTDNWLIKELILLPVHEVRDWHLLDDDVISLPGEIDFDRAADYNLQRLTSFETQDVDVDG